MGGGRQHSLSGLPLHGPARPPPPGRRHPLERNKTAWTNGQSLSSWRVSSCSARRPPTGRTPASAAPPGGHLRARRWGVQEAGQLRCRRGSPPQWWPTRRGHPRGWRSPGEQGEKEIQRNPPSRKKVKHIIIVVIITALTIPATADPPPRADYSQGSVDSEAEDGAGGASFRVLKKYATGYALGMSLGVLGLVIGIAEDEREGNTGLIWPPPGRCRNRGWRS